MRFARLAIGLMLLAGAAGCATAPVRHAWTEEGLASWYGRQFQGRKTASGEHFDIHKLTAAHRTLPFGTRVRVMNRENGRVVIVVINDRGPFAGDRIIDLSYAAARRIGLVRVGTGKVRIEVVGGE